MFVKALRSRCKRDRLEYVASLADDVQANKASSFRAVGQLLGRQRKKPFAPSVLPAVQDAAGDL